jgi:hypothetical protein
LQHSVWNTFLIFDNRKSKIGNLKSREVEMPEAIQEKIESGHGLQATDKGPSGFEPEVLAFCCEH